MKKIFVPLFLVLSLSAFSKSYYVDSSAAGTNDGSSWVNAYDSLHKALDVAIDGDSVLVAEGVYKPPANTDRTVCFHMPSGVKLIGGYPSGGGVRSLTDHQTVLSGDIGVQGDPSDNTYHVISCNQTNPATVLDGLYITGGYADGTGEDGNGGGIYVKTNSSRYYGVTIIRCHVYENYANNGGGIYINQKGDIYYSTIENNHAGSYGGGLYIKDDGRSYNTVIRNNYAGQGGGGVNISGFNGAPGLINCIISNNETAGEGSGVFQGESRVINCTIVNNKGGHAVKQGTYASISNSIIWGNEPFQFVKGNYATIVACAIADPSLNDPGIIVIDSLNSGLNDTVNYVRFFYPADSIGNVSTPEGMTRLIQAYWDILPGSACINKGDKSQYPDVSPDHDYYGFPRVVMDTIDIGVAEARINVSTDSVMVRYDHNDMIFYGNVLFSLDLDLTVRGFDWGDNPDEPEHTVVDNATGWYAYSDTISPLPAPGTYYYRAWGKISTTSYPAPAKRFVICSHDTTKEYAEVCYGTAYVFPDSTVINPVTKDTSHVSSLVSVNGCDSLVTTWLSVTKTDTSVTVDGITLTASVNNETWQWVDCNNGYKTIDGATDQSFTPAQNGSYAVIVSMGACTDTSSCYDVTTVGVERQDWKSVFEVYPNPAVESLTIQHTGNTFSGTIELLDAIGKTVVKKEVQQVSVVTLPLTGIRPGVYFLKITTQKKTVILKILKN